MGSSSEALSLCAPLLVPSLLLLPHRTGASKIDPHQCGNEPRGVVFDGQDDPRRVQIRSEAKSLWL